jgi:hypothetical protein
MNIDYLNRCIVANTPYHTKPNPTIHYIYILKESDTFRLLYSNHHPHYVFDLYNIIYTAINPAYVLHTKYIRASQDMCALIKTAIASHLFLTSNIMADDLIHLLHNLATSYAEIANNTYAAVILNNRITLCTDFHVGDANHYNSNDPPPKSALPSNNPADMPACDIQSDPAFYGNMSNSAMFSSYMSIASKLPCSNINPLLATEADSPYTPEESSCCIPRVHENDTLIYIYRNTWYASNVMLSSENELPPYYRDNIKYLLADNPEFEEIYIGHIPNTNLPIIKPLLTGLKFTTKKAILALIDDLKTYHDTSDYKTMQTYIAANYVNTSVNKYICKKTYISSPVKLVDLISSLHRDCHIPINKLQYNIGQCLDEMGLVKSYTRDGVYMEGLHQKYNCAQTKFDKSQPILDKYRAFLAERDELHVTVHGLSMFPLAESVDVAGIGDDYEKRIGYKELIRQKAPQPTNIDAYEPHQEYHADGGEQSHPIYSPSALVAPDLQQDDPNMCYIPGRYR